MVTVWNDYIEKWFFFVKKVRSIIIHEWSHYVLFSIYVLYINHKKGTFFTRPRANSVKLIVRIFQINFIIFELGKGY